MSQLNRFPSAIVPRSNTEANLTKSTVYSVKIGELATSSDKSNLFIADSNYRFQIVPALNLAVVNNDGDIVTLEGEILWLY